MKKLVQVPCLLEDNEGNAAWLVVNGARAFVVDAPEAGPILAALAAHGAHLEAIVSTHHHHDHVGANGELVDATGCAVVGNADDAARIPRISRPVHAGHVVEVAGLALRVLDVHAHTTGHVAYALDAPVDVVIRHGHGGIAQERAELAQRPALFVGDSLFAAGCGRLFEGEPADLERALRTLASEDPRALVCCGHEYTRSNLKFAVHARPDVAAIRERAASLDDELGRAKSSIPSTLELELRTNPFLLALRDADPVSAVGALRRAKDTFR